MHRVISGGHSCASSLYDSRATRYLPVLFRVDGAYRLDGVGVRVRRTVGFERDGSPSRVSDWACALRTADAISGAVAVTSLPGRV